MPVHEYLCGCGVKFPHITGVIASDDPECPQCKSLDVQKLVSRSSFKIPAHMTDAGMAATARQREWLKTPEAKAMNLERGTGYADDEPEPEIPLTGDGPTADEMFRDYVKGGMPLDASREEIADRAGITLDSEPDPVMDALSA